MAVSAASPLPDHPRSSNSGGRASRFAGSHAARDLGMAPGKSMQESVEGGTSEWIWRAIGGGARIVSDFRVMSDQQELFRPGRVGADGVANAGEDRERRDQDGQAANCRGEYGPQARMGAGRGPVRHAARVRLADRTLEGVTCIGAGCHCHPRALICAEANFKGSGIIRCWPPAITSAGRRRRGCCAATRPAAIPPRTTSADGCGDCRAATASRRRLMITVDRAGARHDLVGSLDKLAARRGYQLTYSSRWTLTGREEEALRIAPAGLAGRTIGARRQGPRAPRR